MKVKSVDSSAKWEEINKCAICMCEVFDEPLIEKEEDALNTLTAYQEKLHKQVEEKGGLGPDYQAVALPDCMGSHCFHKDCLQNQLDNTEGDYIKCAVWRSPTVFELGRCPTES